MSVKGERVYYDKEMITCPLVVLLTRSSHVLYKHVDISFIRVNKRRKQKIISLILNNEGIILLIIEGVDQQQKYVTHGMRQLCPSWQP